jgi:tetratricopeptide (TPR) repeat protein
MPPKSAIVVAFHVALLALPVPAAAQKDPFVDSFIAFHSALEGPYGDEGAAVAAALERMASSLDAWEETQAKTEAALKGRAGITPGELALFYAEHQRFEDAERAAAAAIAAEPTRGSLQVFRGLLQEAAGQRTDAAATFAAAARIEPRNPVAIYLAASRLSPGSSPSELEALAALMTTAAEDSRPQRAPFLQFELIDDVLSKVPVFSPAAYEDGFALFAGGRFRDAVARFKAVAAADPLVIDAAAGNAQVQAGIRALRAKQGPQAIQQLEAAVKALPNSSEAHRVLGVAYRASARLADSIRHFENAVRLAPGDERARVTLGDTLAEAGKLPEAERVLRETVAMLPKSGGARWVLAGVYERLNRGLEAIATLEEAALLTVVAGKAALYWRIAELAHRHQDYERVVTALSQRARLLPNEGHVHKALGLAFVRIGRSDDALVELLMATLLGAEDAETLAVIGQIHLGVERFDAAERALRSAIAADPGNAQARYVLGMTLTRVGRATEAKEQLDEFRRLREAALTEQQRQFEKQPKPAGSFP